MILQSFSCQLQGHLHTVYITCAVRVLVFHLCSMDTYMYKYICVPLINVYTEVLSKCDYHFILHTYIPPLWGFSTPWDCPTSPAAHEGNLKPPKLVENIAVFCRA